MAVRPTVWRPGLSWRLFRKELPNDWCLRITERYTIPFANGYVLQVTKADDVDGWTCVLERNGSPVSDGAFAASPRIVADEETVTALVQEVAGYAPHA